MRGVQPAQSGNLVPYRVELINRIGQEAVDEIESNHNRHRWTVEECRAIKAEYQQKLKNCETAEVRLHEYLRKN